MEDPFRLAGDPISPWEELIQQRTNVGGYVERYYDSGIALPRDLSKDSLVSGEIDRITSALTLVIVVGMIPRRLGKEASDQELATDKKRAKRVTWALTQALGCWTKNKPKIQVTKDIQREGTQLEWAQFVPIHLTQVKTELGRCATWAIRNDDARWGRSAVVNLENELRWFTYALRD